MVYRIYVAKKAEFANEAAALKNIAWRNICWKNFVIICKACPASMKSQ